MDLINNNPYRFLGVYSNSPTKERVANKGKMSAFLKVGKPVSFPLDLPQLLSPIDRNVESVADAESKLTLPNDQIRYAQFWWMKASPLDDIAFNHLFEGNVDMAKSIWEKKDNVSSLQNRTVLALAQGKVSFAIQYIETLYTQYADDFAQKVVGDSFVSDVPLWQLFFDTLLDTGADAQSIVSGIHINEWKEYIGQKIVGPLIDSITKAVTTAKATKGDGAAARLKAGQKLMSETKDSLSQLKKILSATDIRYQAIADKLATEILQCGIDYYNDSDDDDSLQNTMELQNYALSIAVGQMTKDRCKENVDILQNIINNLPPKKVFAEDKAIKEELQRFCQLPDKITHAVTLLNNTRPHLQSIKRKLGAGNAYYLKVSTQVVGNALHNIIEEVNAAQQCDDSVPFGFAKLQTVKSTLAAAWNATKIMDAFDMESDFKNNRYDPNRSTLRDLCNQLEVPTSTATPTPKSIRPQPPISQPIRFQPTTPPQSDDETNWGCILVIVIAIFISFLISYSLVFLSKE